jgi:hypothetical protein
MRWYDEGMGLFQASCSAGDMILERFGARLRGAARLRATATSRA